MTLGTRCLIGVCLLTLATSAAAQAPPKALATPADLDKTAVDVLKDVHNRGAELYNTGDPAGAYRLYQGALLTVRPFLAHHPEVQKLIDDGLDEVAKVEGSKIRAFRLHEVIETVRGKLKGENKDSPKPKVVTPVGTKAKGSSVSGIVTLNGQPVTGAEVTIVTLDQAEPRVFTAKATEGKYSFPEGLPAGKYVVMVTPAAATKIPEKYQTTGTSAITIAVAAGANRVNLDLKSK